VPGWPLEPSTLAGSTNFVNFSTASGTTGLKSLPVGIILDGFFFEVSFFFVLSTLVLSTFGWGTTISFLSFLGLSGAGFLGSVLFVGVGLIGTVVFSQLSSTGRVLFATGIVSGITKVSFAMAV